MNIAITLNNDLMKELQRFLISAKKQQSNLQLDRKTGEKIKKLTLKLDKIQSEIRKFQSKPISLDEMENHTVFTKLPRLQKLAVRVWQQRETLMNRATESGSQLYRKFVYNELKHPQLNQIVEDFFNQYLHSLRNAENNKLESKKRKQKSDSHVQDLPMFTIIDLKQNITEKINDKKIDFQLTDEILCQIYDHLIGELEKRRAAIQSECLDNYHILDDYETIDTKIDENDPELMERLESNSVVAKDMMEKFIEDYKKKDLEKNGQHTDDNSKPIGWDDYSDDNDKNTDDDDDDDEDNDSDNDDENTDNDDNK